LFITSTKKGNIMDSTTGNPLASKQDRVNLRAKFYIAKAINSCPKPTKELVLHMIKRNIAWAVSDAKKKLLQGETV
jgi:hypothetical protein